MADPVVEPLTWRAIQLVKALVKDITVANGYYTDIGDGSIQTDRARFRVGKDGPATLIVTTGLTLDEGSSGQRTKVWDMDFEVGVAVPFGATDPELLAHRALADLLRALNVPLRDVDAPLRFRRLAITDASFDSAAEDGADCTLVQVTARAGLTESATPAP